MKTIGSITKARRIELGFTISEISRASKVNRTTITMIEGNNTTTPSFITAIRICKSLGLNINDIFHEVENEEIHLPTYLH
jgi:DNA-binding XRE family transcriptional regulator